MYCKKCGTQITEDSNFCPKCGESLSAPAPHNPVEDVANNATTEPAVSSKTKINPIIVILIVSVLILFIIVLAKNAKRSPQENSEPISSTAAASSGNSSTPIYGQEVSVDSLPDSIKIFVNNLNTVKPATNTRIGIDAPVRQVLSGYDCDFDSLGYSFDQNNGFLSVKITDRASTAYQREQDLKLEYTLISLFLFSDYDQDTNFLTWQKVKNSGSASREKTVINLVSLEDSDVLVFLVPDETIAGLIPDPSSGSAAPAQSETSPSVSLGMQNALSKALDYLDYTAFSRSGLIEQLKYEGFSQKEAEYGVEHCGADWKEQAAKKAQDYLDYTSFSRAGLIDQLLYEGFSQEEAEYGVSAVGY